MFNYVQKHGMNRQEAVWHSTQPVNWCACLVQKGKSVCVWGGGGGGRWLLHKGGHTNPNVLLHPLQT